MPRTTQQLHGKTVVDVSRGDRDRDRQTGPFGDHMDLRPILAAVDRIRAR